MCFRNEYLKVIIKLNQYHLQQYTYMCVHASDLSWGLFSLLRRRTVFYQKDISEYLKCSEPNLRIKMVTPLVRSLTCLNVFNFLSFCPLSIRFVPKCRIVQALQSQIQVIPLHSACCFLKEKFAQDMLC